MRFRRLSSMLLVVPVVLTWLGFGQVVANGKGRTQTAEIFGEFERLLPRGAISAVNQPEFVSATEARIADDAWVLGVEIQGQARAYSLNLLNRHEIVNDTIGGKPVAAVW
jgi:hypothetical protein